ncbi:MAG: RHS repeat-associated core domain-containing protein [Rhodanobacteraceae bacterium]|nr:RHS repeat-associated core domain-containing protein [Rhodanobacteraceae bacterium]
MVNPETYSVEYVHTDALGSPVAYTGSSGSVLPGRSTRYEPYGTPTMATRDGEPSYTGHQYDASTGLIYAQQRYYDPMLGRFLGVDPMAVDTGSAFNWNRYAYAANSPYKFTDPDGRQGKVAWLVKLGTNEMRRIARLTKEQAVRVRRAEGNIEADRRQVAGEIETAAHGSTDQLKHAGHELADGSRGRPHYQTDGKQGHTFWGAAGASLIAIADVADNIASAADLVDPTSAMTHIADAGPEGVTHECENGCEQSERAREHMVPREPPEDEPENPRDDSL